MTSLTLSLEIAPGLRSVGVMSRTDDVTYPESRDSTGVKECGCYVPY